MRDEVGLFMCCMGIYFCCFSAIHCGVFLFGSYDVPRFVFFIYRTQIIDHSPRVYSSARRPYRCLSEWFVLFLLTVSMYDHGKQSKGLKVRPPIIA